MTPLQMAVLFHETYERLAPSFGYETRQETRAFDPQTPNGRLMVAVCAAISDAVCSPWIYEDELPADFTEAAYDAWFAQSKVIDGVRMGPNPRPRTDA